MAQTWWVQSADYGAGNRRQDVTNTVRRLVSGPNFTVNNNTLGLDPWKGADKTLRIVARDANGKYRDFSYKEYSTVNSAMFRGAPWNGGGGSAQSIPCRAPTTAPAIGGRTLPTRCAGWRAAPTSGSTIRRWASILGRR